jgi:hypothetical protein
MRVIGRLLVALAIAFPLIVVVAGVADGATGPLIVDCATWKDAVVISPGVGNTPANQTATAHGKVLSCNKSAGAVFSASLSMTQATCANLAMSGSATFDWVDGGHSTISLVLQPQPLEPNKARVSGEVTSGRFQGLFVRSELRFSQVFKGTGAHCSPTNLLRRIEFINSRSFQLLTPKTTTTTQPPGTLPSTTHGTTPRTPPTTVPVTNFGGPTTAPPPATVVFQGPPNNGGGVVAQPFPRGTLAFTGSGSGLAATVGFEALLIGAALACLDPERRRRRWAQLAYRRGPKSFLQVTLPPMR